jgi:hypothetical protein
LVDVIRDDEAAMRLWMADEASAAKAEQQQRLESKKNASNT